jgi:ATP-dependent Clp protease ATP-binding subunit ClpX
VVVSLDELDEESLMRILTEPKNALTKQFIKLFAMDGVTLSFTKDGLQAIVKLTIERKTGARGLRSIMERTLQGAMFEAPGSNTLNTIVVDEDLVMTANRKRQDDAVGAGLRGRPMVTAHPGAASPDEIDDDDLHLAA